MKTCSECGSPKAEVDFPLNGHGRPMSHCKKCHNARRAESYRYYAAQKKRIKERATA